MPVHLTSARDAKGECVAELARAVAAAEDAGESVPAVAVGIGRRPEDGFVVAIRTESPNGRVGQAVAELLERRGRDVDVRVIGPVRALETPPFRQRLRPLVPGASVSLEEGGTGTIGGFVRHAGSDAVEILSNNHVLADENRGAPGAVVIQPGVVDGGTAAEDRVGALASFVPIDLTGTNLVDCAVATVDDGIGWSLATFDIYGGLTAVLDVSEQFPTVAKSGRTSGHTVGTVTAIELDNVMVGYDSGVVRFDDQIEVAGTEDASFSAAGDSGSLVVTTEGGASGAAAVGLLFAGSETGGPSGHGLTYVNRVTAVIAALDVDLIFTSGGE
jgi:hypothetical protein